MNISIAKVRLFVGNIPKQHSRDEIMAEFSKMSGEEKSCTNSFQSFRCVSMFMFVAEISVFICLTVSIFSFLKIVVNLNCKIVGD